MRALITGMGYSGARWTAKALRECCGIDARHESVEGIKGIDHVEVNSKLVMKVRSEHHEDLVLVHLIRDGRDVVSSVLDRHPEYGFRQACYTWNIRVRHMIDIMPPVQRFYFERLVSHYIDMVALAEMLGGQLNQHWEVFRKRRINEGGGGFPAWRDWNQDHSNTFWRICGETMGNCGYERYER